MDIVGDLLEALHLADLEALVGQVPPDDDEFATNLTTCLAHTYGGELDDATLSTLHTVASSLVQEVGPSLGGGANPVTGAILTDHPGATYADVIQPAFAATNSIPGRAGMVATDAAPQILTALTAVGVDWAAPDTTIPDNPFGLADPHPPTHLAPSHTAAGHGAPSTALALPLSPGFTVKIPAGLRDLVRTAVQNFMAFTGATGGSNKPDGTYVHLVIQAQYAMWAAKQSAPHLIVLDNKVFGGNVTPPALSNHANLRTWFTHSTWLHDLHAGPLFELCESIIDALGLGRDPNNSNAWPRPDILDLTTHELYEIKSVAEAHVGLRDIYYYSIVLNGLTVTEAVIKKVLESWGPGGFEVTPPPEFWMPGRLWMPDPPLFPMPDGKRGCIAIWAAPGLILYQILDPDEYKNLMKAAPIAVLMRTVVEMYLRMVAVGIAPDAAREVVLNALGTALATAVVAAAAALLAAIAAALLLALG